MMSGKTVGAMVGGVGLVVSSTLVSGAVGASRVAGVALSSYSAAPWAGHLATMDAALHAGDVVTAHKAWHEAYGAALGSRRWDGFADLADASLRMGRASASPNAGVPRARDLYLCALFRARDAGSLDGVLRVADAFEALGDRDVTLHAAKMAERLAGRNASPQLRQRLALLH
jgi:hypothetical protein